jgi:FKBP-type peptidyl-prolyl cis-trans isomerase FkpA
MTRRFWVSVAVLTGFFVGLVLSTIACADARKDEPAEKDDPNTITTDSGLKYQELKVGNGAEAKKGDKVSVHYTGWLKTGKKFDSSIGKNPLEFQLGARMVIQGWDEGVAGMKAGGKRKLIIPSYLGYGERGFRNTIPPNSTLFFEVELVEIK